jgi:MFS family permease
VFGTVWSYVSLRETRRRRRASIDWGGNVTFATGLIAIMIGVTYGIRPYRGHPMGWGSPLVISALTGGLVLLAAFVVIERRVAEPMFRLELFRIRAFTFGVLSSFLSAIARGGLMFMLIIWLQGIWLPRHGYSFTSTPLWAGIFMLPLTLGFLVAGPISGFLSDRYGARPFATGGMLVSALAFGLLALLPVDFAYVRFASILFLLGLSMGAFASPNRAGVMNSLPPEHRGAGGGMNQTFQNSAQVLSIGIFFTLMIVGLAATLPHALATGLEAHGVDPATATRVADLPPVSVLFAAFLGYNPAQQLLGPHVLQHLSAADAADIKGREFFPNLLSQPFRTGLREAFAFAILACLVAAAASWSRGTRYVDTQDAAAELAPMPD